MFSRCSSSSPLNLQQFVCVSVSVSPHLTVSCLSGCVLVPLKSLALPHMLNVTALLCVSDSGLCKVTAIDVRNISFTLSWCMNCLGQPQKKGECSYDQVNLILEFFSFPKHFVLSLSSKNKERNEKKMLPKVVFVKIICQNSIWNTGDVWKLSVKGKNRKWIWWMCLIHFFNCWLKSFSFILFFFSFFFYTVMVDRLIAELFISQSQSLLSNIVWYSF